ncbi:MAG: YIP1 family protein [Ignavibacteriales bacterium]|nr:YIP1 family protein [Ignavibacteriales bacterium]
MDEQPDTQIQETTAFSKLFNMFSEPSAVFEEVSLQEKTTMNWLLPVAGVILVGIVFTFIVFSDPVIKQEMRNTQIQKLEEKIQKGEMTREQLDKALAFIPEPGSPIFLITGTLGMLVYAFASVLLVSLVLMLVGKWFLHVDVAYAKMMEVVGLANAVFILGTIVTILTVKIGGSINKTPSIAFFLEPFDTTSITHHLLKFVDVFSFWYVYVLSLGVRTLYQKSIGVSVGIVGAIWILYAILTSYISS